MKLSEDFSSPLFFSYLFVLIVSDATFPLIEQLVEANLRWHRQDGKPIICAATSLSIYRKI